MGIHRDAPLPHFDHVHAGGLLLMGGGDRNFDAMHWFMKKA